MSDTEAAKKSRDAAYDRVTSILGELRKSGDIGWTDVSTLTRTLDERTTFDSPGEGPAPRTYNGAGSVTGRALGNQLSFVISNGGFPGPVWSPTVRSEQSFSIATESINLSVTMTLSRIGE